MLPFSVNLIFAWQDALKPWYILPRPQALLFQRMAAFVLWTVVHAYYRCVLQVVLQVGGVGSSLVGRLNGTSTGGKGGHVSYRLNLGWGGPIGDYVGFWGDLLRDMLHM